MEFMSGEMAFVLIDCVSRYSHIINYLRHLALFYAKFRLDLGQASIDGEIYAGDERTLIGGKK